MKLTLRYIAALLAAFSIRTASAQNLVGNNLRLNPTSLPFTCNTGDLRIDQDNSFQLKQCVANGWSAVGGGGFTNPMTANGDLITQASSTPSAVHIGLSGTVLTSNGTAPSWNTIVNANVNSAAAITYSKLSLTGGIVNADVNNAAAITYSKLSLTGSIVNADIFTAAAIADTKLATISSAGKIANTALPTPMFLGDGNSSTPAYSFINEPTSGFFRNAAGDVQFLVTGTTGFELSKLSATQINVGIGSIASPSPGNAWTDNYTMNGRVLFSFANLSSGVTASAQLAAATGPSGSVNLSLINSAYATASYTGGGGALDADSSISFLNIVAENPSSYITLNVGGSATTATERMVIHTADVTINKIPLLMAAATAGTISFALPSTVTAYTVTWPTNKPSTSNSVGTFVVNADNNASLSFALPSLRSNATVSERIERASVSIIDATTCVVLRQSGTWISAINAVSSNCSLTFSSSSFSIAPTCVVSPDAQNSLTVGARVLNITTALMTFQCVTSVPSNTSCTAHIICMGSS